ncbi:MAG: adenylate/guanylate cyclase domain-containing protein [Deltaproteobacteria bacterium]|nr:adenylate/guanylate cyclase domain-containing protein [Deltaproteobacteria bacterium]
MAAAALEFRDLGSKRARVEKRPGRRGSGRILSFGGDITTLQPQRFCRACREQLHPEARFCSACGAGTGLPSCHHCHAGLKSTDHYCFRCGKPTDFEVSPAAGSPGARWSDERKIATILFADLAGFTALSSTLEPDLVWELANTCMSPLAREVEARGGTVVKYIGDALMAVFGVPQSHRDDASRAVEAGMAMAGRIEEVRGEIRDRFGGDISLRIGINTGLVMVGTVGEGADRRPDVLGTAVNLASRIETAASPGEVLVGPATWRRVAGRFLGETREPIPLKGIPEPVALTRITRRRTEDEEREATNWMLHAPMMRELELETIQTSFELVVQQGRARIVRLVGEAGLGKELVLRRLWRSFKSDLRKPLLLEASGRRWLPDTVSPLVILAGLLRSWHLVPPTANPGEARQQLIRRLEDQLGAEASASVYHLLADLAGLHDVDARFESNASYSNLDEVVDAFALWLRSLTRRRPVVLLLSDLQRADPASLDALPRLFDRLERSSLLGVLSSEPRLDEQRPGYLENRASCERILLGPLPQESMVALVHELLTTVDNVPEEAAISLAERAEGNPGYARELVRMLHDQRVIVRDATGRGTWDASLYRPDALPETVQGVLQARLDSLPPEEKEVLKRAAVVGRTFWAGAVRALVPLAVQQQVPQSLESLCHQRIIDRRSRSQVPGDEEYVFKSSALRDTALSSLPAGVRRSVHLGTATWMRAQGEVWEDGHLLLASHAIAGGRPQEARWPLTYAARRAAAIYANDSAVELYRRSLELWPAEVEIEERVAVQRELTQGLARIGEVEDALSTLATAAEDCRVLPDELREQQLAWIEFERGLIQKDDGRSAEALTSLESALARLESFEDLILRVRLLAEKGFLHGNAGDHEASEACLVEAASLVPSRAQRGSEAWRAAAAHLANARGILHMRKGEWKAATPLFEQSIEESEGLGLSRVTLLARINLGAISFLFQDFEGALEHFEGAMHSARRAGDTALESVARGNRGQAMMELGRKSQALEEIRAALKLARAGQRRDVIADAGSCMAELLSERGEWAEAETQARESLAEAEAMGQPVYEVAARRALVAALDCKRRARDRTEDLREARAALEEALAAAERLQNVAPEETELLQTRFAELLTADVIGSTDHPAA